MLTALSCPTPPSILPLATWVPQSKLAFGNHSSVGCPCASGPSAITILKECSFACRCRIRSTAPNNSLFWLKPTVHPWFLTNKKQPIKQQMFREFMWPFWPLLIKQLDGVGPVDNRPSTNKLHHFFRKKEKKEKKSDMWHVTRDMWHVTRDMSHVTCDTFGWVNILSKFQLPSSYRLWFMILWRSGGKGWIN